MSDTQDSLVDEQLDARVDALIEEIDTVSANIARAIGDDSVDPELEEILAEPEDADDGSAEDMAEDEDELEPTSDGDAAVDEQTDSAPAGSDAPGETANAEDEIDSELDAILAETDAEGIEQAGDADAAEPSSLDRDTADAPVAESPAFDDQIDAMLSAAAVPQAEAEGEASPNGGIEPLIGDEAEAVLEEASPAESIDVAVEPEADTDTESSTEPARSPVVEAEPDDDAAQPAASVEDLDAELAGLADELLEGDFDDVDDVLEAGDPDEIVVPIEAEPAEEDTQPAESAGLSDDSAVPEHDSEARAVGEDSASEPLVAAASTAVGTEDADAAQAEADTSADGGSPDVAAAAARTPAAVSAGSARTPALQRAKRFVYETAVRTSKPLDGKPTYARDIVGWFAAVTLFNAVAVWAFWVLGREPDPLPTSTDAVSIEVPAEAATADAAVSELE